MNYTQLQAKVAAWLNRTDLTAVIPDFIELVEERMNRDLRVRAMESALAATDIVDGVITPASDVIDVKSLWLSGLEGSPLAAQSIESVVAMGAYGYPTQYAWSGGNLTFDGGGSVQGVLYVRIPALATATTNWVSDNVPSLYLFGALAEACLYAQDEMNAQMWAARFEQVLAQLNGNDQRRPGALVSRAR